MSAKQTKHKYENNPFFVATNGIALFFNLAQGVAILFVILSIVTLVFNIPTSDDTSKTTSDEITATLQSWSLNDWVIAGIAASVVLLAIVMISSLFGGVAAYTSARIARGEEVKLSTAFREAFDRLWSFIWLQIIIFVKVVLWSLLFIIPGIIMSIRYSLAGVAFFDDTKELRGNAAVKESLRLTKGAWLTTYSSNMLFNLITLGAIGNVISTGVNAILYRQFQEIGDKKKPEAHWLSWVALVIPFIGIGIFFVLLILVTATVGVTSSGK